MPKKILLLIPSFGFGGAQRVFSDHSNLFSESYQVEECVFNNNYPNAYPTGNIVHSLDVPAGRSLFEKALYFIRRVQRLKSLKKKNKYDICISHLEGADYINILSKQSEKTILVIHGSKIADENISGMLGWIRKKMLLPWLYKKADTIITVSDGIKEELEKEFLLNPAKVFSIPNFFKLNYLIQLSNAQVEEPILEILNNNQSIIYSGRFAKQKNLLPLFSIFKNIKTNNNQNIKLLMIGDGETKEELFKECVRLNLSYYTPEQKFHNAYDIYFLGYQTNPFSIISKSDIFIMTSKWEGFPMALCEAMAIGACVVASDCPTGPRQILWGSNNELKESNIGLLLPIPMIEKDESIVLWANKIIELLNTKSLRETYKINAFNRAKDFDYAKINELWKSIIEN